MYRRNHALYIAVTAMFSALLVGGKYALSMLPNVEVVTIIIALCAYVWGLKVALPAVFVFISLDVAFFGLNTWVISYLVHWNLLAVAFWGISKIKLNNVMQVVTATILAVVATALFGVLTSAVDTCIGFVQGGGFFFDFDNFGKRFVAMYIAGVSFYITQILCNLALFSIVFLPLVKLNQRAKLKLFGK